MKYKIVADSSCDIHEFSGVSFASVPLKINTEDKEYVDDPSLNVTEMIDELLKYKGKSSTSCPNVAEWEEAFSDADCIFAFTITSGLSGSYNAAENAKEICTENDPKKKIYVFNSLTAGPENLLLIEKTRELINNGEDFDTICDEVNKYSQNTRLLFSLESLHNFAQNGRVSKIAAAAAGLLGIRVLGTASDVGTLELISKNRGAAKAEAAFVERMKSDGYRGGRVNIGHCLNLAGAEHLRDTLLAEFPDADISVYQMKGLCCYYAEKGGILAGFEV